MRSEVALYSYTFENMMYHVLHQRVPKFGRSTLSIWWASEVDRWKTMEYFLTRIHGNLVLYNTLAAKL